MECNSESSEGASSLDHDVAANWKPGKTEYLVMITVSLISLMVAIDATILVTALPTLAIALDGTSTDAFWGGTSYLLTSAVFQPFIAALSDIFGRQQLLLVALLFFTLGTILCTIANDFHIFLAGRSIQGIGGGGIITMGQVIFSDIIPLRQRPKWFAMVLGAWAIGSIIGPVLGGIFVEYTTWRWLFIINFPFCAAGFVLIPIFVKLNAVTPSTLSQKIRRVDWIGSFLFIGSMTSFLIGISWAGVQYAWVSAGTLAPICAGVVGLAVCIYWEKRPQVKEPVLKLTLFNNVSATVAYYCAFAQGFLLFMALFYGPFYFETVRATTPVYSGISLLPVVLLLLPGSVVVSVLTTKLGRFRWAIWSGWTITTLGSGLLILLDQTISTGAWISLLCVFGLGNGIVLTSVNVGIQAISPAKDCARAGSMYAFVRTLGMSVGVAVGSPTFQNIASSRLSQLNLPTAIAENAHSYLPTLLSLPLDSPLRIGVVDAYTKGFHGVFTVMTCVAGTALLASALIRKHSMDKLLVSKFTLERVGEGGVGEGDPEAGTGLGGGQVPMQMQTENHAPAQIQAHATGLVVGPTSSAETMVNVDQDEKKDDKAIRDTITSASANSSTKLTRLQGSGEEKLVTS